jgi:glycosyltransferase involved in cell wall biosynthesis
MKLLTVTVPCYNSAAYVRRCLDSLLPGGEEMDVIVIDDGSTDETGAIADDYAARFPKIVRVIHQENGGHGEGINQGLRHALGVYFKVVDSDDRLDGPSLFKLLAALRGFTAEGERLDLIVNDYVYDQAGKQTAFCVNYRVSLTAGKALTWEEIRRFPVHKQFMIHSLIYRTQLLREIPLELPKHTFYEDNLYIYKPLPYTKRIYYLNEPLYDYFIGREDQSIAEKNILRRLDQLTRMAEAVATCYTLAQLRALPKTLCGYMLNNCAGMLVTTSALQYIKNTEESLAQNRRMWQTLRDFDEALYQNLRRNPLGIAATLPGETGQRTLVGGYRFVRKIIQLETTDKPALSASKSAAARDQAKRSRTRNEDNPGTSKRPTAARNAKGASAMSKQEVVGQITERFGKLGLAFTRGQASDVELHVEFLNAGWSIGKKKYVLDAYLLASEEDRTVYLWQKTTESGGGASLGSGYETSFQSGATLLRKVKIVQYAPEGKAADLTLDLGELTRIARDAARQNGWKFKTVLRREKATYPKA